MADKFGSFTSELDSPATNAVAITPSDSTSLTTSARAIYCGVGGNISVLTVNGQTVTFANVLAGTILPVRVERVNSTGTTASSLVALF